ncbi:hypothetical protein NPX13_g6808 [Xylaria arbuscula]|uniref:Uncharacterized protein n=1 Tax=Xylaria arbuscula TaxID=114810 RepID=A0A9W8TL20_9PEZI|nr:hypothetical protein NPX13_g6808 [Xylaria arbuscula]
MRRTWIVQEVALPRKVDVLIGPVLMDWESLSSMLYYVESLKISDLHFASLGSWKAFLALVARRKRTQQGEFIALSELLFEHRRGKATDARDRIFGLMGLSAEREEMPAADYDASITDVFTKATVDMFRRSGNLDILGLVGPARPDRPDDLPSWVPDYGSPQGPHPVTKRGTIYTFRSPQVAAKFAASCHGQLSFKVDGRALVLSGMILGEIDELAVCYSGQRDDDVDVQNGIGQVSLTYAYQALQDNIEAINISLSWERLSRRVIGRSPTYKPTGESMQDAFFMTYYEGQAEKITDEIRATYALERFALMVWNLLTFGQGCKWLPAAIPLVTVFGFVMWISRPVWNLLGYPPVPTVQKYADMMKDATDRRLCTTTNGLVGLAPPDSVLGDRLALLQGCRVPVVLRQDADGYRLVGEAYIHGAMYGEMIDSRRLEVIRIR